MATYIETVEATVPANGTDVAIGSLTPPENEKYHVVALACLITGAGHIQGGIQREDLHMFRNGMEPPASDPMPVDYEIPPGKEHWFRGSDTSGAPNLMQVMIVYEIEPAT